MDYLQFIDECGKVGKTPSGLAEYAGISRTTISMWKKGRSNPSPDTMMKLTTAIGHLKAEIDAKRNRQASVISEFVMSHEPKSVDFRDLYPKMPDGIVNRILYGSSPTPPVPSEKTKIIAPDNSMIFDCIPKDAEIICRKVESIREGSLVAFHINGENIIRRVSIRGDEIILGCSNPRYTPSAVKIDTLSQGENGIWGEVVSVFFTVD